jgi:hypothetical protein
MTAGKLGRLEGRKRAREGPLRSSQGKPLELGYGQHHHGNGGNQAERDQIDRSHLVEKTFEGYERHDTHLSVLSPGEWGDCYFNDAKITRI